MTVTVTVTAMLGKTSKEAVPARKEAEISIVDRTTVHL